MSEQDTICISRDMTIEQIFTSFPHKSQRFAQEMMNVGLHCVGCHASTWETLEAGMMGHGMDDKAINQLIDTLNGILQEVTPNNLITITDRAAKKYLEILKEENKTGWGLRFEEKAGGCGGFEYTLDYSQKPDKEDKTLISNGIEIYIHEKMMDRLLGSEIDYIDGLQGAGFKISNPNVKSACHCGSSHNY